MPLLVALFILLMPRPAAAHAWSISSISLEIQGEGLVEDLLLDGPTLVTLMRYDRNGNGVIDPDEADIARPSLIAYLDESLKVESDRGVCAPQALTAYALEGERLHVTRPLVCPGTWSRIHIVNRAFQEDTGGHTFLGTFHLDAASPSVGHVFRPSTEELWIDRTASASSGESALKVGRERTSGAGLIAQGVHHILTGFDHLAFVISLVLVVTGLRELALVITSFTLAHSITLALGALDIVCPPAALIEPTICVTILFVAVENLILARGISIPSLRWRPALTFAFGLIHGFGFSNQLRELGLRAHGLVKTLVAFNLGVELGQLLVVLPLFFALAHIVKWFTNPSQAKRRIVFGTSGIVAALALVWLTERVTNTHILPFG